MNTTEAVLTWVYMVLLIGCAVPATWFPLQYRRSNWQGTLTGRGLMAMSSSFAIAVDLTVVLVLLRLTGVVPVALAVVSMAFLNYAAWTQVKVLRRAQRAEDDGYAHAERFKTSHPTQEGSTP